MAKSKQVVAAVVLGVVCLAAGQLATGLVLGAAMFEPLPMMLGWTLLVLTAGTALCGYAAFRSPSLWYLWPMLFGASMFLFGMSGGFSPPDPNGVLLWRTLAVAFLLMPALSSLYGRTLKYRRARPQPE